jgi:hypothetical protein
VYVLIYRRRQILQLFGNCASLRHSTTTLPNIAFTAGTTFLLIAARNNLPSASMREELVRVDQCLGFLRQMSWPAAAVAADILQRMKTEWLPSGSQLGDEDKMLAIANIKTQLTRLSGVDSIEALKDPESDLAKLLLSIGWQPPSGNAPARAQDPPETVNVGADGTNLGDSGRLCNQQINSALATFDFPAAGYSDITTESQPFWGFDMTMEDYVSSDLGGFASEGFASFFNGNGDYGSPFNQT